jgi:hypothetical protein
MWEKTVTRFVPGSTSFATVIAQEKLIKTGREMSPNFFKLIIITPSRNSSVYRAFDDGPLRHDPRCTREIRWECRKAVYEHSDSD